MSQGGKLRELIRLAREPKSLWSELQARPSLMLLLASLTAQGLTVGISPILSRIYTPQSFGTLALISSLAMVLLPMATGRYELGLMRAHSEHEARAILRLCVTVIAGTVPLIALLVYVTVHHASIERLREIEDVWFFLPLGLAAVALYDTLAIEASRQAELAPLAASKLSQALLGGIAQIGLGLTHLGVFGLLTGYVITQGAGVGRLAKTLGRHADARRVTWQEVKQAAHAHRRLPLFTSWSSMLDAGSKFGMLIALPLLWDPSVGGYIFLSDRIVGRPLYLFSSSLLPVYVADVTRAMKGDRSQIPQLYRKTLGKQIIVCSCWIVLVVAGMPLVVGPLFGPLWTPAVPYIQAMALAVAPVACLHGVAHTLQLAGRSRYESVLTVVRVATLVAVIAIAKLNDVSALSTLRLFAGAQVFFAIVVYFSHQLALRDLIGETSGTTLVTPPAPAED